MSDRRPKRDGIRCSPTGEPVAVWTTVVNVLLATLGPLNHTGGTAGHYATVTADLIAATRVLSSRISVEQATWLIERSDELKRQKRVGLDPRWTVTPCGGISKVSSFLSLFGGNKIDVAVLTDFGHGDKTKVRELRESELLANGRVFTADSYVDGAIEADIEDIIGRDNYVALVNSTYSLSGKNALPKSKPASAPLRVTLEVKGHFSALPPSVPEYDHFAPSRHMVVNPTVSLPDLDGALDRFENLFRDLNGLLE